MKPLYDTIGSWMIGCSAGSQKTKDGRKMLEEGERERQSKLYLKQEGGLKRSSSVSSDLRRYAEDVSSSSSSFSAFLAAMIVAIAIATGILRHLRS